MNESALIKMRSKID